MGADRKITVYYGVLATVGEEGGRCLDSNFTFVTSSCQRLTGNSAKETEKKNKGRHKRARELASLLACRGANPLRALKVELNRASVRSRKVSMGEPHAPVRNDAR